MDIGFVSQHFIWFAVHPGITDGVLKAGYMQPDPVCPAGKDDIFQDSVCFWALVAAPTGVETDQPFHKGTSQVISGVPSLTGGGRRVFSKS